MQAQLEPQTIPQYHPLDSTLSKELIIGTIITDNSAVSVEQALKRLGLETKVQRHLHWELNASDALPPRAFDTTIQQAEASGELYNPNKEFVTSLSLLANSQTYSSDPCRERIPRPACYPHPERMVRRGKGLPSMLRSALDLHSRTKDPEEPSG